MSWRYCLWIQDNFLASFWTFSIKSRSKSSSFVYFYCCLSDMFHITELLLEDVMTGSIIVIKLSVKGQLFRMNQVLNLV